MANALLTEARRGRWSGAAACASFRDAPEHADEGVETLDQVLGTTLYTADRALVARIGTSDRIVLVG